MQTVNLNDQGFNQHQPLLSPLHHAILLTVLYADLFDYPLTPDEVYHHLIGMRASPEDFRQALKPLVGPYLSQTQGHLTWNGREPLVDLRLKRLEGGQPAWQWAERYARWLAQIPFVRMVAVSGSLAVDNNGLDGDIDLFIITEKDRLWISRLCLVMARTLTRRLARWFPYSACPNYIISNGALEIEQQDLYTAHEVIQVVPLQGAPEYAQFLQANQWVYRFLPQVEFSRQSRFIATGKAVPAGRWEKFLAGRLGDALDLGLYRLFLFFHSWIRPLTLLRKDHSFRQNWSRFRQTYLHEVRKAFQRNRQVLIGAGYSGIVRRSFARQVHQRLGQPISSAEFERLFPSNLAGETDSEPHPYTQAFHVRDFKERYGNV